MGILTSTEALFFWLGVLALASVLGVLRLQRGQAWRWYAWCLTILGVVSILFGIAWYFSSLAEGEPQAANMGVVFFVVPGLVLLGVARRLVKRATVADAPAS